MPGKIFGYPESDRSFEIHHDGSVTLVEEDGTSISVSLNGTVSIRKPGHGTRTINAEIREANRKFRFNFDGKVWTVTIRENEVEFETTTVAIPPVRHQEKFDRDDGENRVKEDGEWSDPLAPDTTTDVPVDPVHDAAMEPVQEIAMAKGRRNGKARKGDTTVSTRT